MIRVVNVTRKFGEQTVLNRLNLTVGEEETVAVVGRSGCGKTTLLRILAGLDREYSGRVFLGGQKAEELEPNERDAALVMQEPVLWPHMTVEENILFPIRRKDRRRAGESIGRVCGRLEIDGLLRRLPGQLSGGQAKRVSLARALCAGKRILLLDEPLSNIDKGTSERILSFLREEYAGRCAMVYVTHVPEEADALGSRVVSL